jgi:hypothetical protein
VLDKGKRPANIRFNTKFGGNALPPSRASGTRDSRNPVRSVENGDQPSILSTANFRRQAQNLLLLMLPSAGLSSLSQFSLSVTRG